MVEVTLTTRSQIPGVVFTCLGTTPPVNVMEVVVLVTSPPHCEEVGGEATSRPAGRLLVIDKLVRIVSVSVLRMRIVKVLAAPTQIVLGANVSDNVGVDTPPTPSVAVASVGFVRFTAPILALSVLV